MTNAAILFSAGLLLLSAAGLVALFRCMVRHAERLKIEGEDHEL